MVNVLLWLLTAFVLLVVASTIFQLGRTSLLIESADYRQTMWRPLSSLSGKTIVVVGMTLQLLSLAFHMGSLSWRGTEPFSDVVLASSFSILFALVIGVPVFNELYARYCHRFDQSRSHEDKP